MPSARSYRDRNEAIRTSTDSPHVLMERHSLSEAQISRIRSGLSGVDRPLTRRQEAAEIASGAWRADCMTDAEWAHWIAMNPMGLSDAMVASRPCIDCPLGFAAEMRAEGRCNGTPGWRPPVDDDDEAEEEPEPREASFIPRITLADSPVTPRKDQSPMEATPEPIEATPSQCQVHALEELQSSALEALEAIQEHELAETAITRAEEIREAALRRLMRAQDVVRDILGPTDRVASAAERRHEQLLHGDRPDPSTADPHPDWTTARDEDRGVAPLDVPPGVLGGDEPADDAPETVTSAPARREAIGGESKRDAILAAVIRFRGDIRAIAADRNTTRANVIATLHTAGQRGLLTPEMIEALPAGFAKYSGVRA